MSSGRNRQGVGYEYRVMSEDDHGSHLTDRKKSGGTLSCPFSYTSADEICLEGLESLSPEAAQHLQKHECVKTLFDLDAIASSNDGEDEGEIIAFEGDGLTVSYTTS